MSAYYEPLTYGEFISFKPINMSWDRWLSIICGDVPPSFGRNLAHGMIESEAAYSAWLDFADEVGL